MMQDSIFTVVMNVGGGKETALNIVFSRCIETYLECLLDGQAIFTVEGALVFKREITQIVNWVRQERDEQACDYLDELLDADVLNRLHSIIVVLSAPLRTALDEQHSELALCMEMLPDLDAWLSLRADKGKKDVATTSGNNKKLSLVDQNTTNGVTADDEGGGENNEVRGISRHIANKLLMNSA